MGVLLLASTQMKRGDDLGDGIDGQPEPLDASPDFGVQLIQLDEGQDQALEGAVVQENAVGAHALEPARDSRVGMTCVADHDGDVDAFGHEPEDHLDAVGSCLEIVEWGVASAGEIGSTPLTAKLLDVVSDASYAVADKGMDPLISDAEVVTLGIEAGETGGADLLLATSNVLALGIGVHFTLDRA